MAGFQCSGCSKYQLYWEPRCRACGREGYLCGSHKFDRVSWTDMATLARNLAIAALGCASFELGRDYQHCIENAMSRHDEAVARRDEWHPGCGRSAP